MAKLSKEELEGLRELVGVFKAVKNIAGGLGSVASGLGALSGAEVAPAAVAPMAGAVPAGPPPKKRELAPANWADYTACDVTLEGLKIADREGYSTAFHRARVMTACPIGKGGTCCKICNMGPCRVLPPKGKTETPEERKKKDAACAGQPPRP